MTKPTKLTFDIDPYKGAAAALVGLQIEEMRLVSMKGREQRLFAHISPLMSQPQRNK
jgi:hypothetical protein